MKSLEELKMQKRRLVAKESLKQHSMERNREKSMLKKEIFQMKNPRLQNIKYHVRGRVGMAKKKIQTLLEKEKTKSKNNKRQGFGGFDMKKITG